MNILKHGACVGLKNIESRATLDIPMWRTKDLSLLKIDKQKTCIFHSCIQASRPSIYMLKDEMDIKMHIWGETLEISD